MEASPKVYRAILENMSEAVYVRDLDMNLLYVNPTSERLTGLSLQEAMGKKCYEVFGDAGQTCRDVCPIEKAISERLPVLHHVGKLETRSGEVRDMQISISPLCEGETITGAVVTMNDVTQSQEVEQTHVKTLIALEEEIERRQIIEEALRRSEERFRALFEQAADSIVLVDAETGAMVEFNDRAHESLGYTREEFQHLTVSDFEIIESAEQVAEHIEKIFEKGADIFETKHRTREGEVRDILVSSRAISIRDKGFIQSIWRDITERKRAEDALRQRNRELALLNQTSQVFSSILDLDQVLVTVLEETRSLMDVVACSIWLTDHETGELVCQQATGPGNQVVRGWRLAPGVGVAGWTVRSGESLIVPDTRASERYCADVDWQTGLLLRSILSIPLRVKENVIGVLQVVAVEANRFDAADLMLLEPLAVSAAIAIENARLYEQAQQEIVERVRAEESLRQYAERLSILHEIEQAILGAHVPEDIAQAALQRIGQLVPYVITTVTTFDLKAGEATVLAQYHRTGGAGSPEIGRVSLEGVQDVIDELRRGKVQVLEDVPSSTPLPPAVQALKTIGVRSYVSAPLIVGGELIGSLNVGADAPSAFVPDHIEIVREVADQLAIVLQQARLREQVERYAAELGQRVTDRTRELETLYAVTAIASESLDLDAVLKQSLEQSLAAVECQAGAIHLLNEIDETSAGEALQLAAWLGVSPLGTDVGDLAAWVVEHGVSWVTSDVTSDPRTHGIDCAMIPYAYVGVPMRSRGREVGVFSVVGRAGQQFSAEEVALLASIADHVAGAVESARLRKEAERTAVMDERERLARELHDSVTQLLYSLSLFAETGRRLAGAGELQDTEDYLNQIGQTAQQALKEMRMLVHELRPPVLEREGLVGALQQRLDAVERRAGVDASLLTDGLLELPVSALELPVHVEKVLYHIAQEALNNALRHAVATSVQVRIRADDDRVELEVADDGRGFDLVTANDTGGLGLIGMREWAERLGGELTVLSALEEGTTVRVVVRR